MATIRPFKAIRPADDLADKIAALPYDVMNTEEAREMVKDNPYSFLHIDRAEIDLPEGIDPYAPEVYEKARDTLNNMIADGQFVQDAKPCFYLYRLVMNGRAQTGLAVTASVEEYEKGIIKKHELTRADKEQDRINHVNITNAHTGPIFLAYRDEDEIRQLIDGVKQTVPIYDFVSEDGIGHTVWKIDDDKTINALIKAFKKVPNLYIADGHHRNASAAKVAAMRRAANPHHTGKEGYNFYLSVLFPDDELAIMDYNRVVKDLNGLTEDAFLNTLKHTFTVNDRDNKEAAKPKVPGTFGMYLGGKWYTIVPKEMISDDCIKGLDVSVLQDRLLTPILGIGDIRTDKRIDFVGGIRGLGELEARVDSGEMKVAFAMYPTTMAQLFAVADEDKIMPPKSTWFEPKLRSGLLIHSLDD